jgi:hypothetical protein
MSRWFLIACSLGLLVGCGGQKAPSSSPAESPEAATAREAELSALLNGLTQAVRKYAVEQRRAPKSLEELTAQGYLSALPPAPAGKKFAITPDLKVHLADH